MQIQNVMGQIPLIYRIYTEVHRKNVKGAENIWIKSMGNIRPQFLWKE